MECFAVNDGNYFNQQSHHRKEGIKTFPKRLHSSKSLVGSKSYPMEPTSLTSLSSSVVVDDRLNECTHIMSVGLLCARATTLAVLRRTDRRHDLTEKVCVQNARAIVRKQNCTRILHAHFGPAWIARTFARTNRHKQKLHAHCVTGLGTHQKHGWVGRQWVTPIYKFWWVWVPG